MASCVASVRRVRAVLAPNPGLMTGPGTNQYLVGADRPLVIDVAAYEDENARRFADGLAGARPATILLTHIHPDHVGGATALRESANAPLAVHRSRAGFVFGGRALA